MEEELHPVEIRVLASLVEKELATPEHYPLTLNALINACNQRSNREPVTELTNSTVEAALRALQARNLVATRTGPHLRKEKYAQRLGEQFKLKAPQLAVLAELMLRGPQTPGSLRARASRMVAFPSLEALKEVLEGLALLEPPLALQLARQPGRSERRWCQLLGEVPEDAAGARAGAAATTGADGGEAVAVCDEGVGDGTEGAPGVAGAGPGAGAAEGSGWNDPLAELRAEVRSLRQELLDLRTQFLEFRASFE
jgi:uncharacterized protein YceH (UPF0502 family)